MAFPSKKFQQFPVKLTLPTAASRAASLLDFVATANPEGKLGAGEWGHPTSPPGDSVGIAQSQKGGPAEAEETTKKAHSLHQHFTCFSTYTQGWLFSIIHNYKWRLSGLGVLRSLHSALPLCRSTVPYIPKANSSKKQFDREAQITGSLRGNASLSTSSVIWDQTQPLVTASLRIMKPVCITANILLFRSTIFSPAKGC